MPVTPLTRIASALVAGALMWIAMTTFGPGTPLFWVAVVIPDVALLGGGARGRLNTAWVPLYNALHTWWTPIGLGLAALVAPVLVPVALGWAFHVAWDRALGYGLRTPDGFQRHHAGTAQTIDGSCRA